MKARRTLPASLPPLSQQALAHKAHPVAPAPPFVSSINFAGSQILSGTKSSRPRSSSVLVVARAHPFASSGGGGLDGCGCSGSFFWLSAPFETVSRRVLRLWPWAPSQQAWRALVPSSSCGGGCGAARCARGARGCGAVRMLPAKAKRTPLNRGGGVQL